MYAGLHWDDHAWVLRRRRRSKMLNKVQYGAILIVVVALGFVVGMTLLGKTTDAAGLAAPVLAVAAGAAVSGGGSGSGHDDQQ
jgi:hypothetical protein